MGCLPPQRNQATTASASNPIKKVPSIKKADSYRSRNSSNSTERHLKASVQNISSSQSLKQAIKSNQNNIKNIQNTLPPKNKKNNNQFDPRFSSKNNENIQNRKAEKPSLGVTPPKLSVKQELKNDELSKIVSVHSLDIHSCIKIPEKDNFKPVKIEQNTKKLVPTPSRNEDINITFNSNNFVSTSSKSASLGMGKRWREQTLRQELQGINQQNFKKIVVQIMPFN